MDYDAIREFIRPELLVLIPVLFCVGLGLKKLSRYPDEWIPFTLGGLGIVLAVIYVFSICSCEGWREVLATLFAGVTQGILTAGAAVFLHQLGKQYRR